MESPHDTEAGQVTRIDSQNPMDRSMNQKARIRPHAFFIFLILCLIIFGWPVPGITSENQPNSTQSPSTPSRTRSAVADRIQEEKKTGESSFVITPHRPNYLLSFTYNANPNSAPFSISENEFDNVEVKFQLSLKYQLIENILKNTLAMVNSGHCTTGNHTIFP